MQKNLKNLLTQAAKALEAQDQKIDELMSARNAKDQRIREGLLELLDLLAGNDNGNNSAHRTGEDSASPVALLKEEEPNPVRKTREIVTDAQLLDCLSSTWIGAGQVLRLLVGQGLKVSEGTVYNRMRKLATQNSNIETAQKPERWRLKSTTADAEPLKLPTQAPSQRASTEAKAHTKATAICASANDNHPTVYQPRLHHGDCLEVMKSLPDDSVDVILADLPYGTTRLDIDRPIQLDELWTEYRRVLKKPHGNIVLFGSQPFTSKLVNSAEDIFRHSLVWEKNVPTGFQHASAKPLKRHEDVLVFSCGVNISGKRTTRRATYNPQGALKVTKKARGVSDIGFLAKAVRGHQKGVEFEGLANCPDDILRFPKDKRVKGVTAHPFAKPVALLEYLIRTYSNAGEVVLDNTMGSGSTGIAALNAGRQFIGIEKNDKWFEAAKARIEHRARASTTRLCEPPSKRIAPAAVIKSHDGNQAAKLYRGDCLEVMRTLPSGSVDLVFTSPPYNLGMTTNGRRQSFSTSSNWRNAALAGGYASYDDARPFDEYVEWQKEVLNECWRLLSPTGAIFYQHKPRMQGKLLTTPLDYNPDLPLRQIVIWNRKSGNNFNSAFFLPTHEWITIFAKPDFKLKKGGWRAKDVWTINPERNNPHPAPFPVELPRTAIEATNAKVIFDPFLGSGSTGVAAMQCGRNFVGIEIDGGYLQTARERIDAEKQKIDAALCKRAA